MTEKSTPTNKASAKSTDAVSKTDNADSATAAKSLGTGTSVESTDQAQPVVSDAVDSNSDVNSTPVASNTTGDNAAGNNKGSTPTSGSNNELSDDVVDLITELRDTVKRLDPRRHTVKTLRRALSSVRDILGEIDSFL